MIIGRLLDCFEMFNTHSEMVEEGEQFHNCLIVPVVCYATDAFKLSRGYKCTLLPADCLWCTPQYLTAQAGSYNMATKIRRNTTKGGFLLEIFKIYQYFEFIILDRSSWYFPRWGGGQGAKKCPLVEHNNTDKLIYFRLKMISKTAFGEGFTDLGQKENSEMHYPCLWEHDKSYCVVASLLVPFLVLGWSYRNMKLVFFIQRNALQQ